MTRAALTVLATVCLAGCGGNTLRGRVVEGPASSIAFASENDARFLGSGVGMTRITLTLDPDSLGRKLLANIVTQPDGTFEIPVREFGAGLLEYKFELLARSDGYDSAQDRFKWPGNKRVLVTLKRGHDRYRPEEDPLKEARPYLDR